MEDQKPTTVKTKESKSAHPAVGMWKDKWAKEKSSTEIAREMRKKQWQRS
ncbi:MAG TPA: hypothetical protein VFM80_08040 [Gracilimonas sp.]|nr:hypothetical protein [Gracilimonas sp.]